MPTKQLTLENIGARVWSGREPQSEKAPFQPDDWLCALCLEPMAHDTERFFYQDRSEFRFDNPAGYTFHILTFLQVLGCVEITQPTLANTWFAGHSWSVCVCRCCRIHVGWRYTGTHNFYGLIRPRLIKGWSILN